MGQLSRIRNRDSSVLSSKRMLYSLVSLCSLISWCLFIEQVFAFFYFVCFGQQLSCKVYVRDTWDYIP